MFLYFAPGNVTRVPPDLEYAFDGPTWTRVSTAIGPLGMPAGTLFGAGESVRLDVAHQDWTAIPNTPYAIGVPKNWKPNPESLKRESEIPGHWVTLGDGSKWLVAIAHGFDLNRETFSTPLPRALEYNKSTGRWIAGPVVKRYRKFLELAIGLVDAQTRSQLAGTTSFNYEPVDELAMMGLSTNYRVSSIELSFFEEAYTLDVRQKIIHAILDYPTLELWRQKKRALASAGSTT